MKIAKASIVTITDTNFVIAVYLLICSLRYKGVKARIYVLGVNLSGEEAALLEQFPDVEIHPADISNKRNPTNRKGEALLMAKDDDSDYITLMDGDCLVTGDISEYLTPNHSGLYLRIRDETEDAWVYRNRYQKGETPGYVPQSVLDIWRRDVGGYSEPQTQHTVLGGNLTISRDYLSFAERWQEQICKVVPDHHTKMAHNPSNHACFQFDESVLNSLLAFDPSAPPIHRGSLDADSSAYVAHLGPANPKPWKFWRKEKLQYYPYVLELIDWAKAQGYMLPLIPWTFKQSYQIPIYVAAYAYAWLLAMKQIAGRMKGRILSS